MPKTEPSTLLIRAKEKEKTYNWTDAAKLHEKAIGSFLLQKDSLKAGEIAERIGYCLNRAAMQAKSRDEFEKRMRKAIGAYQRAQEFYASLPAKAKSGGKHVVKLSLLFLLFGLPQVEWRRESYLINP